MNGICTDPSAAAVGTAGKRVTGDLGVLPAVRDGAAGPSILGGGDHAYSAPPTSGRAGVGMRPSV